MSTPPKDTKKEAEAFVRMALSRFSEKKPSERAIKKAAQKVAEAHQPVVALAANAKTAA
jgi:hypothetical protein